MVSVAVAEPSSSSAPPVCKVVPHCQQTCAHCFLPTETQGPRLPPLFCMRTVPVCLCSVPTACVPLRHDVHAQYGSRLCACSMQQFKHRKGRRLTFDTELPWSEQLVSVAVAEPHRCSAPPFCKVVPHCQHARAHCFLPTETKGPRLPPLFCMRTVPVCLCSVSTTCVPLWQDVHAQYDSWLCNYHVQPPERGSFRSAAPEIAFSGPASDQVRCGGAGPV